ncbi:MAG: hypothetical protein M1829_000695 [Trizodia sp. TS-e1964]|nr:MAG: hypothetical protein M1829_000695 [Trizodia sp. TS-e1964]
MDAYSADYLVHNLPFVLLSGLGCLEELTLPDKSSTNPLAVERGIHIRHELPQLTAEEANKLLHCFLDADSSNAPWNGRTEGAKIAFSIGAVGRDFTLPPRKAKLPPTSQTSTPTLTGSPLGPQNSLLLHSPLSPLSPGSPLFPDGLVTPFWIKKHQMILPSAFISFFALDPESPDGSSNDHQIKTDINNVKKALGSSTYKCRYAVVLLCSNSISEVSTIEDRLSSLRRSTGLDSKTSFFVLPPSPSDVELINFVSTVLTCLQPLCLEYYRDLSKHARRKKNRGVIPQPTVPPTSGTSQTLSSHGWNVRYEFKLGIFAEFRQEMDSAGRNYEGAYEGLLKQEVFESISSWSPRWNESRLLADVLAFRIIRCLLWGGQTTTAVQSWQSHKYRMRDLVDRRGKGSASYGWEAWEARWARIMAELLKKSHLPLLVVSDEQNGPNFQYNSKIFLPHEKSNLAGERLLPWELLHHPGYWYNKSTNHLHLRRALAREIPEEDRSLPGKSLPSQLASKTYAYDNYLCPEPYVEYPQTGNSGINHSALIIDSLQNALHEFSSRGQIRMAEQKKLEIAQEYMRKETWLAAIKILRPLWQHMTWRSEEWIDIVDEVSWTLKICALHVGDADSILRVEWELLSNVNVNFAFKSTESNVGETLESQLVISSNAHAVSAPVIFSELMILHSGNPYGALIRHVANLEVPEHPTKKINITLKYIYNANDPVPSHISTAPLNGPQLMGEADLSFRPGQTKIFVLSNQFREAGLIKANSITFLISNSLFDLEYIIDLEKSRSISSWWTGVGNMFQKKRLPGSSRNTIKVLPKAPKIELRFKNIGRVYYTNEPVEIQVEVTNKEDEEAEAALYAGFTSYFAELPSIYWKNWSEVPVAVETFKKEGKESPTGHSIGLLQSRQMATELFSFHARSQPAEYIIELTVLYHLLSDPETAISKIATTKITVISPFESNYDFSPLVHPDTWPNFFETQEDADFESQISRQTQDRKLLATGIPQKWSFVARIQSLALDELTVAGIKVLVPALNSSLECSITPLGFESKTITPTSTREIKFIIDTQRLSLEDRHSASLDLSLQISWQRLKTTALTNNLITSSSTMPLNTVTLSVPRLLLTGGEPRVLVTQSFASTPLSVIQLDYIFENPSMHFLTFEITMDASEDFAFSGPKVSSLQLVPLSRHSVRFSLLPLVFGQWIQPHLGVQDSYFNKILRPLASQGVAMDKKGILIWVNEKDN